MSDQLVRAISKDGFVKAAAVSTRALTERARQIHQTSPVATAALGRLLAAGSMMGNDLKGEGASVTLRIKGDGPLGTLLVVADNQGNVRGSVQNPQVDLPVRDDGKLDVGGAVGHGGTLTVIKDLNMKEPYVGSVELLGGDVDLNIMRVEGISVLNRLESLHFSVAFMGALALNPDYGFAHNSAMTSAILEKVAQHSDRTVVLLDSTKLSHSLPTYSVPLSAVQTLVTDDDFPPEVAAVMRSKGIEVL